jgi:hypothetical protein
MATAVDNLRRASLRNVAASGLALATTLIAVPTVLGALPGKTAFAAPFTQGDISTRGWSSPQPVEAQRLRIGAPVEQTLTIENSGSLPARYELSAQIDGDREFADHLWVVAIRRSDGATIFSGPATKIRSVALGRFSEHMRETFRMRVTLTGVRGNDNVLQGRSANVNFGWTATAT